MKKIAIEREARKEKGIHGKIKYNN